MSRNQVSKWAGFVLSVVLGSLFLSPISALAQEATGTILGTVSDPQGAVVPGATVTATNTDTHFTRTVPTEADGAYRLPALPVGNYEVTVTKEGFETSKRAGLVLQVGQEAVINVAMQVGTTSQTVEVTEQAPLVETTTASVGAVVNEQSVADLPLNGRSWASLTLEQAGVAQTFLGAPTATSAVFNPGVTFSANGAPERSNNTMMDGAILQSMTGQTTSSAAGNTLGLDGIQEYRVITSVYSAEYPLLMGSQTSIASKAGTNGFHGDAFEYIRNSSLDARNYFDPLDVGNALGCGTTDSAAFKCKRLPPFRRNNFGGALGGPIQKDKTFFDVVYEGLREQKGISITTNTMPVGCFTGLNGTFLGLPNSPTGGTIPAACTGAPAGTPNQTISPAIQQLLMQNDQNGPLNTKFFPSGALFPAPNLPQQPGYNYTYPATQPTIEDFGQVRLDHSFSANDSGFLRFTMDQTYLNTTDPYPTESSPEGSISQYATASESHVFSPTLLQTVRYSFSRTWIRALTNEAAGSDQKSFVNDRGMGGFSPGAGAAGAVSGFAIAGPDFYYQKLSTTGYDVVWTRGKHSIKMGALWNYFDAPNQGIPFYRQGTITFGSLSGLFAPVPTYVSIIDQISYTGSIRTLSYHTIGFYGEDDYRVTPRLTLNLGLRYEFATVPNGPNHYADENPATFAPVPGTNFNNTGYPIWGTRAGFFAHSPGLHNFSPRVGLAWDVRGNGKTAVRAGAGIYYDVVVQGGLYVQESYFGLPESLPEIFTNSVVDQLTPSPAGTGFLDPLTAARPLACATIVLPTLPPCQQGSVQFNSQQPSMGQWNLSIDQQLPWGMAMTLSYVGTAGWHLWKHQDSNFVNTTITANGTYGPLQLDSRGVPYYCVLASDGTCAFTKAGLSAAVQNGLITNMNFQRINPLTGSNDAAVTTGRSWYNAMQFVVKKNLGHGLQFQSAFTWSKLMDLGQGQDGGDATQNTSAPSGPNGDNMAHIAVGRSLLDLARNWQVSAIYHVPDVHSDSLWAKPLKGWWTAPILAIRTGFPFTPFTGGQDRMLATATGTSYVPSRAANYNPNTVIKGTPKQWFDPTQFALGPAGQNGNEGRDFIDGPNGKNLDWSFNKDTKVRMLGEQGQVQFRAEIFNIFNHAAWGQPNATVFNVPAGAGAATLAPGQFVAPGTASPYAALASAGTITSTFTNSRQIQLALKLVF